eukprot:1561107-Rhodomonas_salina.5
MLLSRENRAEKQHAIARSKLSNEASCIAIADPSSLHHPTVIVIVDIVLANARMPNTAEESDLIPVHWLAVVVVAVARHSAARLAAANPTSVPDIAERMRRATVGARPRGRARPSHTQSEHTDGLRTDHLAAQHALSVPGIA